MLEKVGATTLVHEKVVVHFTSCLLLLPIEIGLPVLQCFRVAFSLFQPLRSSTMIAVTIPAKSVMQVHAPKKISRPARSASITGR